MKKRRLIAIMTVLVTVLGVLCTAAPVFAKEDITSLNATAVVPVTELAAIDKSTVMPVLTVQEELKDTVYFDYTGAIALGQTGWFMKDTDGSWLKYGSDTFSNGSYRCQVAVYFNTENYDLAEGTALTVDGEAWERVGTGTYSSWTYYTFASPEIRLPGTQLTAPAPITHVGSSNDYTIYWKPVEEEKSYIKEYEITVENVTQIYGGRTKTITADSSRSDYNLGAVFRELTSRTGANQFAITIRAIAKENSGYADSEPVSTPADEWNAWTYDVPKILAASIDYDTGRVNWIAYPYEETKYYYYRIIRKSDGKQVVDGYYADNITSLPFESFAEQFSWENGEYDVTVIATTGYLSQYGKALTEERSMTYDYVRKIRTVSITGVPMPMEGNEAKIRLGDLEIEEDHVYTPEVGEGSAYWREKRGGVWEVMTDTEIFSGTGEYLVSIPVLCDEGYQFANSLTVKINGTEYPAEVTVYSSGTSGRVDVPLPVIAKSDSVYVVKAGALNVRSSPGTDGDRLGGLSYGDVVEAEGQLGAWTMITYEGQTAWVNTSYLALTYSEDTAFSDGPVTYEVAVGALRVRDDISTSASTPTGMTEGKEVLATGARENSEGTWLVIDYEQEGVHHLGYMLFSYTGTSGNTVYTFNGTTTPPVNGSGKEDDPTPELTVSAGSYPKVTFVPLKAVIAIDKEADLSEENFENSGDGFLITTVFPDDAQNFTDLKKEDVSLAAGLEDLELVDLVLNADGSVTLKLGIRYTVTVTDDGNGTAAASRETGVAGTEITLTAEPKAGYTFKEWEVVSGDVAVEGDGFTLKNEDVQIRAIFEKEVFTITYDLNGGTLDGKTGTVTQSVSSGSVITLPEPAREGYVFDYWEGSRYEAGENYTVTGDHTFKAQWKKDLQAAPETGDRSLMGLWAALSMTAVLCLAAMIPAFMKRRTR